MPELPEVESFRLYAERHLLGKRITGSKALANKVLVKATPDEFVKNTASRTVAAVKRVGKVLWFEFGGEGKHLVVHFGMSGKFHVKGQAAPRYYGEELHHEALRTVKTKKGGKEQPKMQSAKKKAKTDGAEPEDPAEEQVWPPKHWKFLWTMDNGLEFAFSDARMFGKLILASDPRREPPVKDLGLDVLQDMEDINRFLSVLRKHRRQQIKAVLLNQGVTAGVGNYIADECLYQSCIHPHSTVQNLDDKQLSLLYEKLRGIVKLACEVNADATKFPKDWLFHRRWGGGRVEQRDVEGNLVKYCKSGGRTSAYVPQRQQKPPGDAQDDTEEEEDGEDDKDDKPSRLPAKRGRQGKGPVQDDDGSSSDFSFE